MASLRVSKNSQLVRSGLGESGLATSHLLTYRNNSEYSSRPPNLDNQQFADETKSLIGSSGVFSMSVAPEAQHVVGRPGRSEADKHGKRKFLWLIGVSDVFVAEENGAAGKITQRGYLSHTNLSGGADAHAGGELWYRDDKSFWMNGSSSRYRPRSKDELNSIVDGFRSAGYTVCSCGWLDENAAPARFFRSESGEDEWT